jgi:hypothetical protein
MEEEAVAPVAESAAPVAEAAPAAEASAPEPAAEATPAETPSYPSADEFGWDGWDGNDDDLPELLRPWGSRFQTHYQTWADDQVRERVTESDRLKDVYEALIGGQEDPRVGELGTKIQEWEQKYGDSQTSYGTLKDEYDKYKSGVNQAIEQEADEYAKWFKETNADIFGDQKLSAVLAGLLEEGWNLEAAAEAARLPEQVIEMARRAKADGVPEAYAIRLAQGAKSTPQAPRPGARITSGATVAAKSPEQVPLAEREAASFSDLRKMAARNALKSVRRTG